jgi:type I restriction enzyme, R subunit
VITNLHRLHDEFPKALARCLVYFHGLDRTLVGYEGLLAAQERLPDNDARDHFAQDYSRLSQLWEALSPDTSLTPYHADYRWLSQVYESVKPPSGHGKLLWYSLGAKTLELIHENVFVEQVRDDLDTLIMDADFIEDVIGGRNSKYKAKEVEIKLIARLRKHNNDPRFVALGQRLEELKDRHEKGLLVSIEYLKALLELAQDTVRAEREVVPEVPLEEKGIAALTELFNETRTTSTPVMVERVVADIDEIVRIVRFPGWQTTNQGEREVKQALRRTLSKYQLHKDQDLFDKAYGYIREYY